MDGSKIIAKGASGATKDTVTGITYNLTLEKMDVDTQSLISQVLFRLGIDVDTLEDRSFVLIDPTARSCKEVKSERELYGLNSGSSPNRRALQIYRDGGETSLYKVLKIVEVKHVKREIDSN